MGVEALDTRADEKYYLKGGDFFRLLVYPWGYVFLSARISAAAQHSFSKLSSAFALHEICEQSGGMTKTALPIRLKPAWAGKLDIYYSSSFILLRRISSSISAMILGLILLQVVNDLILLLMTSVISSAYLLF